MTVRIARWASYFKWMEKIRVTFSVKNQRNIWLLLELLEKWLSYKLRRFWTVFKFFFVQQFSKRNISTKKNHIYFCILLEFTIVANQEPLVTLHKTYKEHQPEKILEHKIKLQRYKYCFIYESVARLSATLQDTNNHSKPEHQHYWQKSTILEPSHHLA